MIVIASSNKIRISMEDLMIKNVPFVYWSLATTKLLQCAVTYIVLSASCSIGQQKGYKHSTALNAGVTSVLYKYTINQKCLVKSSTKYTTLTQFFQKAEHF